MTFSDIIEPFHAVLLAGGAVGAVLAVHWLESRRRRAAERERQAMLEGARREAADMVREARLQAAEESLKVRAQGEEAMAVRERELATAETRLADRERLINSQLESLVAEEKALRAEKELARASAASLESRRRELDDLTEQRRAQLQALARMTVEEARSQLLKESEQEALSDAGAYSRHILEEARVRAEDKARRVLAIAIQRYAGDHASETTTTSVALPNEELKGRIIGRDGRNIRAFEAATGVTVLIDDTPNTVVLSAFDPIRRETARTVMERLLADGRIHPGRIEELAGKVAQEMDEAMTRLGEETVMSLGLPPLHAELTRLLGSLKFRHSFSQNVLEHSIEVAHLAGLLASELGLDSALARRAGLLHDIGKAVNHEVEGPHAKAGAEIVARYGESDAVVKAVASHHDEMHQNGPLSILVSAADAISASRPGARSETMAVYLKRVEDLERIGQSFPGVEKVYAVQAGREVRVFVQPEAVDDEAAYALARNLARRIEAELHYPGQIRVTVMRETRCVEFAK